MYFEDECKEVFNKAISYFDDWNKSSDGESVMAKECFLDISCCLKWILELISSTSYTIQPGFINSDLIELHFSQVREFSHNQMTNVQ